MHIIKQFQTLIHDSSCELIHVKSFLDQLDADQQLTIISKLKKRDQQRLWVLIKDPVPIALADLIPEDFDELEVVTYSGKNTLWYTLWLQFFKKGIYRFDGGVYGANSHLINTKKLGAGYFTVSEDNQHHEIIIDYSKVSHANGRPQGWSPVKISRGPVFGGLKDRLRKVSNDFFIGEASKGDKVQGLFMLYRGQKAPFRAFKAAMMAMMPATDQIQGISGKSANQYLWKLKNKGNKTFISNVQKTSAIFIFFLLTKRLFLSSFEKLSAAKKDEIMTLFSESSFAIYSTAAAFIRLNAGLCWGADCEVRKSLGFTPYEEEPKPNLEADPMFKTHIRFLEKDKPLEQREFDYVIIGSGPGGAAAAYALLQATKDKPPTILIIEKGEWRGAGAYASSGIGAIQSLLDNQGMTIAKPSWKLLPNWPIIQANAVGGTSVINSAICVRTPDDILNRWFGDDADEIKLFKEKLDLLAGSKDVQAIMPTEPANQSMHDNAFDKKINDAAKSLYSGGITESSLKKYKFLDRYTEDCDSRNACFRGCPIGAKQSLNQTILSDVMSSGDHVSLLSNAHVQEVHIEHFTTSTLDVANSVSGHFIHPKTKEEGAAFNIKVKKGVILAASAIATPLLLKKSVTASATKPLDMLGKSFQAHPGSNVIGVYDKPVYHLKEGKMRAVTQGWGSTQFRNLNTEKHTGFKIETQASPLDLFSGRIPLSGTKLMQQLEKWDYMGVLVQACQAEAKGEVQGSLEKPKLKYELTSEDVNMFRQGIYEAALLHKEAGATHVMHGITGLTAKLPVERIGEIKSISNGANDYQAALTHLFGGCIMGRGASDSVCDMKGKLHYHKNIYVVDASVLPSNIGVNPQQTIMANAMRIATHIAKDTL